MKKNNTNFTFTGLLTLVFITLKLCHVINWSWWWVLSPIPISVSIGFIICFVVITIVKVKDLMNDQAR